MMSLLEVLRFNDGCVAYVFNKDKHHHIATRPGETITFGEAFFPQIVRHKVMKVDYPFWERHYAQ